MSSSVFQCIFNFSSKLQNLYLQNCSLGDDSFLMSAISITNSSSSLVSLDLSFNLLKSSSIFYWLFNSTTNLRTLELNDNMLEGPIPDGFGKEMNSLEELYLSHNNIVLSSPVHSTFPSLVILDLSYNKMSSSIFQCIFNFSSKLQNLYLQNCSLGDDSFLMSAISITNSSSSLVSLDLSFNLLKSSSIFYWLFNSTTNLRTLELNDNMLEGPIPDGFGKEMNSLEELYLSHNNIVLSSPVHSTFPSLVILDLSYNKMSSSIFQCIFNFSSKLQNLYLQNCSLGDDSFLMSAISITNSSSSLVSLDLSFNLLKSSSIFYWLFNSTTNLRTLELNDNMLEGPIPDGFGKEMNSLEVLSLFRNKLQGEIPSFFGNMCTLQSLDLSNNKLSGQISSFFLNSSWCNRHVFRRLLLSGNNITGRLPKSIGLLSELIELMLAVNYLEGDVTESHLSNFSKLSFLQLSDNSLSLKIGPTWFPPFQLLFLALRSCNLGPTFPNWLQTQTSIIFLDISNSNLNDSVPDWFWNNLQNMGKLNMSYNNLIGTIPNISLKLLCRPFIFLHSNQFEGKIPPFLLQASKLKLSKNKFSNLFSFLCDQSISANLLSLDLSNNQMKGQLPNCWKYVDRLLFLDLSNNKLSGKIHVSMGSLVNLEVLVLRNNNLMGELPSTLKNCSNLIMVDVSENILSGPIPSWIGESMQQLIILNMRGNHFSGHLPVNLCYLKRIQSLDLSRNNLSRGIPTCLKNLTVMSEKIINRGATLNQIYWSVNLTSHEPYAPFLSSSDNYTLNITWIWKGMELWFSNPELQLKSIDLSSNNLTGEIPKEIGYLIGLVSLNLSRNHLSGEIPSEIGNLSSLESLDLSRNHISGAIPFSLSQIDNLGKLDLSHNSLSGKIPRGRHFGTFEGSSFEGNVDLCGEQLNKSCPRDGDQTTVKFPEVEAINGDEDSVFYEALYMSMGIGFFTGFWGLLGPILLWHPWRNNYIRFMNRLINYIYERL
ncbi:receptor-like protein EIX2 [Vigna umbellata]|uniref:receptor-like protein EIX2 n=1 Tax=Vigna umbellata TaxID=87088 RepID=UPI001F5F9130|nr:receptor-like protein EIX2 [Vigna umbellata]